MSVRALCKIARTSQYCATRHARPLAGSTTRRYSDSPAAHVPSNTTSELKFINSIMPEGQHVPAYRVLDGSGNVVDGAEVPEIDEAFARRIYENMVLLPTVDNILYNVQRQGKISFYMTSYGEEATIIGTGAALADDDEVLGQYREMGVLLWRGFGLPAVMNQCFGNNGDRATKGRQMPMHFGAKHLHFHTISSPLGTQIPQAAGVGYALKRDPTRRDKNIAAVYMGDGAASEGDFHAGMLLSATIPTPTLFLVRNNGFAISTPAHEQYGTADGIVARGPGYGLPSIRVDGNDVLAVLAATRAARKICLDTGRGVMLEAMTYRVGHHSTSDDSFAYRPRQEVEERKRLDDPIGRFRVWLERKGWWDEKEEEELKVRLKKSVMTAFKEAENLPKHPLGSMFDDVYAGEQPWTLKEQKEELRNLLQKYGEDWEPYKTELQQYEGKGKDVIDGSSS